MSDITHVVTLTPLKASKTIIRFDNLKEREQFLSLLNKSSLNSSISLFEIKQEDEKDD